MDSNNDVPGSYDFVTPHCKLEKKKKKKGAPEDIEIDTSSKKRNIKGVYMVEKPPCSI